MDIKEKFIKNYERRENIRKRSLRKKMAVSISKNPTESENISKKPEQSVPIAVNENKIDQNQSEQTLVNNDI